MGLVTDAERQEFEALCAQHPEIAEARTAFETALEEQLLRDAIPPPAHLKELVAQKIQTEENAVSAYPEIQEEETTVRGPGIWRWLAAASLLLLAGAAYWAISSNNKYRELQATNRRLEQQLEQSAARLDTLRQETGILTKQGVRMATLQGTADPSMYATVYWDTTAANKDVYLMVNNLPQPASDKQYQLWALMDGQPIDLGVFVREERLLIKMKNVQHAQAFAITLEPRGGSATPTSPPLVVSRL